MNKFVNSKIGKESSKETTENKLLQEIVVTSYPKHNIKLTRREIIEKENRDLENDLMKIFPPGTKIPTSRRRENYVNPKIACEYTIPVKLAAEDMVQDYLDSTERYSKIVKEINGDNTNPDFTAFFKNNNKNRSYEVKSSQPGSSNDLLSMGINKITVLNGSQHYNGQSVVHLEYYTIGNEDFVKKWKVGFPWDFADGEKVDSRGKKIQTNNSSTTALNFNIRVGQKMSEVFIGSTKKPLFMDSNEIRAFYKILFKELYLKRYCTKRELQALFLEYKNSSAIHSQEITTAIKETLKICSSKRV